MPGWRYAGCMHVMPSAFDGEAMVVMSMTSHHPSRRPACSAYFTEGGVMMIALAVIIMIRFH